MILTTTPSVEGQTITPYRGIVSDEAIIGAHIFRKFSACITDLVGEGDRMRTKRS